MNTNITDTMKHLLELSKRGVDGEKRNAEALLKKLMKKYNITEEDLSKDDVKQHDIRFKTKWQEKLIGQILYMINPKRNCYKYTNRKAKITIIELTDAEFIEWKYMYDVYCQAFEKELDIFTMAFIQKNNIFPKDEDVPEEIREQQKERSQEEYFKILKAAQMANGIDYTTIRKGLGNGNS